MVEVKVGDRIVGNHKTGVVRGNVRAINGDNVHVIVDGNRMVLLSIADLVRVNGKKV